jgi:aryl-alcohol dehydrogenase-like predicted oxidoreductase
MDAEDHASERVLADLIATDREHFVVATKHTSSNTRDVSRSGNSFKAMRQTVDGSLRALRTDYLDLLWLHTWDGTTPVDEVLRGASQLVAAGKILYFGFSDTPAWVVSRATALADAHGWTPPIAIQIQYNLAGLDLVLAPEQLDRLEDASAPPLGFPQGFLGTGTVRRFSTSGYYDALDNHRALGYAEFAIP